MKDLGGPTRGAKFVMSGVLTAAAVLVSCGNPGSAAERPRGQDAEARRAPLVAVAGDIACGPNVHAYNGGDGTATQCRQKYTARLLRNSDAVWTLGDHAYPAATRKNLRVGYAPTWGKKKEITYPTPGDHDYDKLAARRAYRSYFGRRPYYSFVTNGWRVFSLNSEIGHSARSAQVRWLKRELSSTRADCIAAYWSVPRWTSGSKAPGNASYGPFWRALYRARADMVLAGDSHHYERFAPQTPKRVRSASGMRQFVVGTGGRSLDGFPDVQRHSRVRIKKFGVLKLMLHEHSYSWRFVNEAKRTLDSGSARCH